MEQRCGPLLFLSNFDSGNLAKAEYVEPVEDPGTEARNGKDDAQQGLVCDYEFNVWTKPDCMATEFVNGNRTWFYFGVKSGPSGKVIRINVMNMNRQTRLYSQGMAPVFKVSYGTRETSWERLKTKVSYQTSDGNFILSFSYKLPESRNALVYFAFCFPFSYTECQAMLTRLQDKYSPKLLVKTPENAIYFHRELLCYSLEGRRVDLITVSSYGGITSEREDRIYRLFPDAATERAHRFHGKKVYFLTARVHPGETPSSFVFNGFLDFILNENDPRAHALRQLFVFKLIPMINPDGVYNGFYRTDTRGVNLNRVYLNPDPDLHPSVYGIRNLILYHHEYENGCRISNENCINDLKSNVNNLPLKLPNENGGSLDQLLAGNTETVPQGCDATGDNFEQSKKIFSTLLCKDSDTSYLFQETNCKVENCEREEKHPITETELQGESGNEKCDWEVNKVLTANRSGMTLKDLSLEESKDTACQPSSDLNGPAADLKADTSDSGLAHCSSVNTDEQGSNCNEWGNMRFLNETDAVTNIENNEKQNNSGISLVDASERIQCFGQNYQREDFTSFDDCAARTPNVAGFATAESLRKFDLLMTAASIDDGSLCGNGASPVKCIADESFTGSNGYPVVENPCVKSVRSLPDILRPVITKQLHAENSVFKEGSTGVGHCKSEGEDSYRTESEHEELTSWWKPNNASKYDENSNELYDREINSLKIKDNLCLDPFKRDNEDNKSSDPTTNTSNVAFYVDLHGHATKRGCFIYANHMESFDDQIETLLFPKLMSINSQNFDFEACNFSLKNMMLKDKRDGMSKEGSGRVAIYKTIGLIHSYTLECNYNTGRITNPLPLAVNDNGRATPPMSSSYPPKYSPDIYAQVGRALAISALDMLEANPWSRIPASDLHTLQRIRQWLSVYIRSTHNPLQVSKKNGRSKSKEELSSRGSFIKKAESARNIKKLQPTLERKPIALVENRNKDLSFESVNNKESKAVDDKKKLTKSIMEVRISRVGGKISQGKKERNESLPSLGLQQKPLELLTIKGKSSMPNQSLIKKEALATYKVKALPKTVNKPVKKSFSKSIKTLQNGDIKKKQLRCEKTKS